MLALHPNHTYFPESLRSLQQRSNGVCCAQAKATGPERRVSTCSSHHHGLVLALPMLHMCSYYGLCRGLTHQPSPKTRPPQPLLALRFADPHVRAALPDHVHFLLFWVIRTMYTQYSPLSCHTMTTLTIHSPGSDEPPLITEVSSFPHFSSFHSINCCCSLAVPPQQETSIS